MKPLPLILSTSVVFLALGLTLSAKKKDDPANEETKGDSTGPAKRSELFDSSKVWNVHLTFTPAEWEAMEPKGGNDGPFGRPGGPGGGPGRRFGPAMFLAPGILQQADADKDNAISKDEFTQLATQWFANWDKDKAGAINADQVREGLNSAFMPGAGPAAGGREGARPGGFGPGLIAQEGKRNGVAGAAGVEFNYVHADLDFEGKQLKNVAVRYKGNGTYMMSRGSEKKSLKIDLNKYEKGQKLTGITTLNLHSGVADATWMNEALSYRLYRDANVPSPRTSFARVTVTVPGKYDRHYLGLYSLVENVDSDFTDKQLDTKKGAILKPSTRELFTDLGDDWKKYNQMYDPKTDLTVAEAQRVMEFSRLVSKASDEDFAAKLPDYVDLDESARYFAVTVWLATMDSILGMGQNYYVYLHPKTNKFIFLPWDMDQSFGQFGMAGETTNLDIRRPWRGSNSFLDRLFKVEAFNKLYLNYMEEFSHSLFEPERFQAQVEETAAVIRPAVKEESAERLARFDKLVAGEEAPAQPFGPGPGPGPVQPANNGERPPGGGDRGPRMFGPGMTSKPIKAFAQARAQAVLDQLAGKPIPKSDEGGFPGGPGGRRGFGPGMFLGDAFMKALDADKDQKITQTEFLDGFAKWFTSWNSDQSGRLTEDQLRAGVDRDFGPQPGGGQGAQGGPGALPSPPAS